MDWLTMPQTLGFFPGISVAGLFALAIAIVLEKRQPSREERVKELSQKTIEN
jgi:hypothetical protein